MVALAKKLCKAAAQIKNAGLAEIGRGGERGGVGAAANALLRTACKGEQPVGVAVWALADDLVAQRIDAGDRRLTAVEWKSGSNLRIIELVAPFGGEAEMREQVGTSLL
jgi:hypothetical protein